MSPEFEELKLQLTEVLKEEMATMIAAAVAELDAKFTKALELQKEQLIQQIVSNAAELHVQMQEIAERLEHRGDDMNDRLNRQGGILRAGGVWSVRVTRWCERKHRSIDRLHRRMGALERQRRRDRPQE